MACTRNRQTRFGRAPVDSNPSNIAWEVPLQAALESVAAVLAGPQMRLPRLPRTCMEEAAVFETRRMSTARRTDSETHKRKTEGVSDWNQRRETQTEKGGRLANGFYSCTNSCVKRMASQLAHSACTKCVGKLRVEGRNEKREGAPHTRQHFARKASKLSTHGPQISKQIGKLAVVRELQ